MSLIRKLIMSFILPFYFLSDLKRKSKKRYNYVFLSIVKKGSQLPEANV